MSQKKAYYKVARTTRTYRFYKYMEPRWLADLLLHDQIKVTHLSTVNDPLEWQPQFETREQETQWQQQLTSHPIPVLCLSSRISTTAMWGHYAAAHKGIALAFDLPLNFHMDNFNKKQNLLPESRAYPIGALGKSCHWLMKVNYTATRPPYSPAANPITTLYHLISCKGQDWANESEYRIRLSGGISHKSDGTPICRGMRKYLSGIILGLNTPPETELEIRNLVAQSKLDLPIIRASRHLTDYSIIAPPFQDTDIEELDNWTILNYQAEQNHRAKPQS